MKKVLLIISLISIFTLTSCNKDNSTEKVYKNTKVVVNMKTYNKLKTGMTEDKVWSILGGKWEKIVLEDASPTDIKLVEYGCNGYGDKGANVILSFDENHKLYIKTQYGLK